MIISRTPYRVSFAGGGTDLPAYCDHSPGFVVSTTIQRYVYVMASRDLAGHFQPDTGWPRNECAGCGIVDWLSIKEPLQVAVFHEVPSGTGLGSSSSEIVGLLRALAPFAAREYTPLQLADRASHIEINEFNAPVGRQDQYAAACGGLNAMAFGKNGKVNVERLRISLDTIRKIEERALMVYLDETRYASEILGKQSADAGNQGKIYIKMVDVGRKIGRTLEDGDIEAFQSLLIEGWLAKRSLGCGISNTKVDDWYEKAMESGAKAGKLCGAGGSGFLFLMAPPGRHHAIRAALGYPKEVPFRFEGRGSEIIYNDERSS